MFKDSPIKFAIAVLALIILLAGVIYVFARSSVFSGGGIGMMPTGTSTPNGGVPAGVIKADSPLFTSTADKLGLGITQLSGYLSVSPDGSKMFFNGFNDSATATDRYKAHTFVAELATGRIVELEGNLISDWVDNNVLMLTTTGNDVIIHDLAAGTRHTIAINGNIYRGVISPDKQWYAYSTEGGLRLYNFNTRATSTLSTKRYEGATAWFSDSKRILGYRETSENLYEAGRGRQLAIWNIENKQYQDLSITLGVKSLRNVSWLVQDRIARVNAGYDDGSHDYIINLENNSVVDLGDTSGMLMGGMAEDRNLGLLALVGATYVDTGKKNSAGGTIFKGTSIAKIVDVNGKVLAQHTFAGEDPMASNFAQRESVRIVDDHRVIYVKKKYGTGTPRADVVLLDLRTGTETVIQASINPISQVDLMPDRKTWIAADQNRFYLGQIQ